MKQIYVIAIFLLPVWSFSQLYVTPNGSSDSYLYVEGALVFVENQITLSLNPSENTKPGIYLRKEGQLLQGSGASENKGTGIISIFQEGKASAYTYNYWGSPVQNTSADKTFGNIIFEPLGLTNSRKTGVTDHLNGRAIPLTISKRWIHKFSGNTYSDWQQLGNIFDLQPGEGFTMKGVEGTNTEVILYGVSNNPGNQQRYDFRGRPNNGNIQLSVKRNEIRLIGNPYPSGLDLRAFLLENTDLTGIAYFWDSALKNTHYLNEYEGGYGAYAPIGHSGSSAYVPAVFSRYDNAGNPLAETGETGDYYSRDISPVAQGFMVEGRSDGFLKFENSQRVFQKEDPLYSEFKHKKASVTKTVLKENIFLRLNVEFNNKYVRQLMLVQHPEATAEVDHAMDAKNIAPLGNDIGWLLNDGNNYLINVIPAEIREIPLITEVSEKSNLTFMLGENTTAEEIYILDKHTGIYYHLQSDVFKVSVDKDKSATRFVLVLSKKESVSPTPEISEIPGYLITQNNKEAVLEIQSPPESSILFISLFDNSGRKIFTKEIRENIMNHSFSTEHMSTGMYHLMITDSRNRIISKKILISN